MFSSPSCCIQLLSKTLNLIGLRGDIKGKFSKKIFKILLLDDEAENWQCILALDIALYKSYDFYSGQTRTLIAIATYCFHRLIIWKFLLFHCR